MINEKINELAKQIVDVVNDMKVVEVNDGWEGHAIMELYTDAKRILSVEPKELAIGLECACEAKKVQKKIEKIKKTLVKNLKKEVAKKSEKKAEKKAEKVAKN